MTRQFYIFLLEKFKMRSLEVMGSDHDKYYVTLKKATRIKGIIIPKCLFDALSHDAMWRDEIRVYYERQH